MSITERIMPNTVDNQSRELKSNVATIAAVLSSKSFPSGDRAALKRMNLNRFPPLCFYQFATRHLPNCWSDSLNLWQCLVQGMAWMSTIPNFHRPDSAHSFGLVLAVQRYSEARLERLLAADDDIRPVLVLSATRFLTAKYTPVNWNDIAILLFTCDDRERERFNMNIATHYFSKKAELDKE